MTMPSSALFNGEGGLRLTDGQLNALRVQASAHRLASVSQSPGGGQAALFSNLCLSLARGIDYAISNDDKPECALTLPFLMKLVRMHHNDFARKPAIMVLLFSLKSACNKGWFSGTESDELRALADQVGKAFCTSRIPDADQGSVNSFVSEIISRFYPGLKLGHIFVSLEVKAGFGAYVADFLITKCITRNGNEKIKLLVASKDDIDTSSCLVSPKKVNFLLNGVGVDGRTNLTGDQGPQPPTLVEHILKYGTNLLQAVGQFDGNCVILIAFMSSMAVSELPAPPDYVQPTFNVTESDDLIEGSSRISLLCPISHVRIKTPAKGHICRHHQCFDLNVYVQMNMKHPSWRCPYCNQAVCYKNIRIDQKMLKILQEVDENTVEVILSGDGSWTAVVSINEYDNDLDGETSICIKGGAEQPEKSSGLSNDHCEIYDLTEVDDDVLHAHKSGESKPIIQHDLSKMLTDLVSSAPSQGQEYLQGSHVQLNPMNVNQQSLVDDNLQIQRPQFSQSIATANYGFTRHRGSVLRVPNAILALPDRLPTSNVTSQPSVRNYAGSHPALSPRTSTPLQSSTGGNVSSNDLWQLSNMQSALRQYRSSQVGAAPVQVPHLGYEDSSTLQALHQLNPPNARTPPVVSPPQMVNPRQMPQMVSQPQVPQIVSPRQMLQMRSQHQMMSQPRMASQPQMPQMVSCPLHLRYSQVPRPQIQPQIVSPADQSMMPRMVSQPQIPQMVSQPQIPPMVSQPQMPQMVSCPPRLRSSQAPRPQIQPIVSTDALADQTMHASQQSLCMGSAQQSTSRPLQPNLVPVQMPTKASEHGNGSSVCVQAVTRTEDLLDVQAEQNWRPSGAGRMRGSLDGRVFSNALDQTVILPTYMSSTTPLSSSRPS